MIIYAMILEYYTVNYYLRKKLNNDCRIPKSKYVLCTKWNNILITIIIILFSFFMLRLPRKSILAKPSLKCEYLWYSPSKYSICYKLYRTYNMSTAKRLYVVIYFMIAQNEVFSLDLPAGHGKLQQLIVTYYPYNIITGM